MKTNISIAPMSADAYAGFLRLLLTPMNRAVKMTPDVRAYLAYCEHREPLSGIARVAMGERAIQAA